MGGERLQFAPKQRFGVIRNWRHLCADVVAFTVDLDSELTFKAGQFAALRFPGVEGTRCYSMVNSDSPAVSLDFVIKRKPTGTVSQWMFADNRSGEAVDCFGPVGKAVFDSSAQRDILCIAGGTGIAGMMSILRRAADHGHFGGRRGDVFFGLRTSREAFFLDDLNSLANASPAALSVTIALSEEAPPDALVAAYPALAFDRGLVHEVAARKVASPTTNVSAYVAGPPAAVTAALRLLLAQFQMSPRWIRYDKFG